MKIKHFIVLSSMLLFAIIACNQKADKLSNEVEIIKYYDTGEIRAVREKISEHESKVRVYFKSGALAQEEMWRDSLRTGTWKIYFNDGTLRAEVIFSDHNSFREVVRYPIVLDFENNPTEFRVGDTYRFRVLGVSESVIASPVRLRYERIPPNYDDGDLYTYEITPRVARTDTITVYINTEFKTDTIFFPIRVVE